MADAVIAFAAFLAALGGILGALYAIFKVSKRVEGAIGVDSAGRSLSDRMERVEHQLWPNGGSSLADQVAQVDRGISELRGEQKIVRRLLTQAVEPNHHSHRRAPGRTPGPRR